MNANTSLIALLCTLAASCVTNQEPPSGAFVSAHVEALEGPWPLDVMRDAQLRDVDFAALGCIGAGTRVLGHDTKLIHVDSRPRVIREIELTEDLACDGFAAASGARFYMDVNDLAPPRNPDGDLPEYFTMTDVQIETLPGSDVTCPADRFTTASGGDFSFNLGGTMVLVLDDTTTASSQRLRCRITAQIRLQSGLYITTTTGSVFGQAAIYDVPGSQSASLTVTTRLGGVGFPPLTMATSQAQPDLAQSESRYDDLAFEVPQAEQCTGAAQMLEIIIDEQVSREGTQGLGRVEIDSYDLHANTAPCDVPSGP